jgi:hypothetical protein
MLVGAILMYSQTQRFGPWPVRSDWMTKRVSRRWTALAYFVQKSLTTSKTVICQVWREKRQQCVGIGCSHVAIGDQQGNDWLCNLPVTSCTCHYRLLHIQILCGYLGCKHIGNVRMNPLGIPMYSSGSDQVELLNVHGDESGVSTYLTIIYCSGGYCYSINFS